MADTEILNVLLKIENPQVFDRIEKLKSEQFQIKFSGSLDKGIKDILALQDKKISITADVQGAINSLKQVETSLKSLQGLKEIKLNLTGNLEKDVDRIGKKIVELQAKLLAPELTQMGKLQNNNPKTFSGDSGDIILANTQRAIAEASRSAAVQGAITVAQQKDARANAVQSTVQESTARLSTNPGQGRFPTQVIGETPDDRAIKQARVRRLEAQAKAEEEALNQRLVQNYSAAKANFASKNTEIADIARTRALDPFQSGSTRDLDSAAALVARARREDLAKAQRQSQQEFDRGIEIANTQIREESLAKLRANLDKDNSSFARDLRPGITRLNSKFDATEAEKEKQRQAERVDFFRSVQPASRAVGSKFDVAEQELAKVEAAKELAKEQQRIAERNDFFQSVQPGVRGLNKKFNTNQLANEEKRVAQLRELGQSAALGALQGQGALSVGGSLLGSLVGSAAPGGAAFGGLVGGALGASAERSIESITRALEKASEAGLSFETSILGISSVLQATTRVSGPGGEALGLGDQLSFQQGQARSIQKLARTKLLPLGISGDKESTLVQSIISGAAQRGIQLTPEQAATLAERLGGAIQSQRPELLGNSGQLRRDVEDLFSGAPQNTVLKTLTKGFAPGLGKATSAEDLIKRSEGLASFPETLRSSTTNPVVAAQKLNSAVDNLNTTVGDALVTALIPGVNALAKELANPQLLDGVEKMGAAIGGVASFFATASAGLIGLTTDAVRLVTSIPGAAGGLVGVAARRAIGRGSSAENDLLELQEKKRGGFFSDEREINAQIAAAQKKFNQENIKNKVTPKASVELAKALRGSGIEDLNNSASPDLKSGAAILVSLEEASKQIRKETLEGIQDAESNNKNPLNAFSKTDVSARIKDLLSNETTQRLGLSLEKVGALRKDSADKQSLFDTSSPLGLVNKTTDDVEGKAAIRAELENTVKLAEAKRAELKKDALPEDVKKANESVRAATYELIKARNDEREAVDKLKESEISRAKVLRDSQFDPRTLQGQAGLIQSGIKDAESRIGKSSTEIGDIREKLSAPNLNPTDRENLKSRLEKATLDFNKGQVDRSGLSAQAQNNVIGLAEGSFSAEKALFDFKQANEVAAEKLLSFADKIAGLDSQSAALTDQIAKSKRNLEDFDASKRLRDLGREGNIIDAAERALKSSEGNFGAQNAISSKIPQELRSLVKGDFFFNQFDRDQFEVDKGLTNFDDVLLKNSPGRFATEEAETRRGLVRSIDDEERSKREIARTKKSIERDKDAAPFEDTNRRFALLKNLVGLNQQGVNIGAEGQKAIQEQSKALGIDLPGLKAAETLSAEVPANVSSINETVKQILGLLGGTPSEPGSKTPGDDAKEMLGVPKGVSLDDIKGNIAKEQSRPLLERALKAGMDGAQQDFGGSLLSLFSTKNSLTIEDGPEELKKIVSPINDNPINFSDSLIARPSVPSRAYNPILREGLGEGLGNKADAKTNAVLEDVVGGFLDADVDGLKKQNRAPASGLKNGLFSGGLFGDREDVKSGKGTAESNFADSVNSNINDNFNKLGDIISKALGGIL